MTQSSRTPVLIEILSTCGEIKESDLMRRAKIKSVDTLRKFLNEVREFNGVKERKVGKTVYYKMTWDIME